MLLFLGLSSFSFLHFFGEMDFFFILLVIVLLKLRTIFLVMFIIFASIALNFSYAFFSFEMMQEHSAQQYNCILVDIGGLVFSRKLDSYVCNH